MKQIWQQIWLWEKKYLTNGSGSCGVWLILMCRKHVIIICSTHPKHSSVQWLCSSKRVCVPVNYKPFTVTHFKSEIGAYQPDLTGNRLSYIVRRPFPQRAVYFWLFLTEVARFTSWIHVRILRTAYWSSRISKRRVRIKKSVSIGCGSTLSQAKIKKFSKNQILISKNRSQLLLSPTKIWALSFLNKYQKERRKKKETTKKKGKDILEGKRNILKRKR